MEEKKKRVRPTWAMVRALEAKVNDLQAKLDDQIDGTSMLVQDCDGWRDKYRALLAERDFYRDAANSLVGRKEVFSDNEVSMSHDVEVSYPKSKITAPDSEYIRNFFDELGAITDSVGEMGGMGATEESEPVEESKPGFWSRLFRRK